MSIPKKVAVNCSHCNKSFETTIWQSVNTDLSPDLPNKIINGSFFDAKCPECGYVSHLNYDFLYHDMVNQTMIWIVHKYEAKEYEKQINDIRKSPFELNGYTTRLVNSINELREKVAALSAKKDDRLVELCKEYIRYIFIKQNPTLTVENIFYSFFNNQSVVFIYTSGGKEHSCILTDELYNAIKNDFLDIIQKHPETPYPIYNCDWAKAFFSQILN